MKRIITDRLASSTGNYVELLTEIADGFSAHADAQTTAHCREFYRDLATELHALCNAARAREQAIDWSKDQTVEPL